MTTPNVNKFNYFGTTIFDISGVTVDETTLANGVTAADKDGNIITGTNTYDSDTSADTAMPAEILATKTAHARGAQLTGSMPNRGAIAEVIDDKDDVITIPVGYHDGSGTVQLDATEKSKVIAGNIKSGVVLLGVTGDYTGSENVHLQAKTATPSNAQQVITADQNYTGLSQVTINAIPYTETPTPGTNGVTVTIG